MCNNKNVTHVCVSRTHRNFYDCIICVFFIAFMNYILRWYQTQIKLTVINGVCSIIILYLNIFTRCKYVCILFRVICIYASLCIHSISLLYSKNHNCSQSSLYNIMYLIVDCCYFYCGIKKSPVCLL